MSDPAWLPLAFAVAAFLYASVGHGGASAYLALGALAGMARSDLAPMALLLNVIVASLSAWAFRAHLRPRLLLALAATSVPAAFLGARVELPTELFSGLLGAALMLAGLRLGLQRDAGEDEGGGGGPTRSAGHAPLPKLAPPLGGLLGLFSGLLGIGGGIFLSPLALTLRWTKLRETAALSAAFIVCNSVSGLLSFALSDALAPSGRAIPLLLAAAVGGLLGAQLGARRFATRTLRLLLGFVLLGAGAKLMAAAV